MIAELRSRAALLLRRRLGFPLEELTLARLNSAGFRPRLVLDVGASHGLFVDQVVGLWPEAQIHCFEPEPEYTTILENRARRGSQLHVCRALVGASNEPSHDYYFDLGASSVLPAAGAPSRVRTATMITLDTYCDEHGLRPEFLKIDVQGYELEVLKGAERTLGSIEVVFTEVNHIEIYRNAPLAAELIEWLARRGYALHDICNFMPRPRDGALWQTDMVFVRHESSLRASKEW